MGVKTKVAALDRDVRLLVDELLSPAAQQRQFAEAAREHLAEADAINRQVLGRVPRSRTWVDGSEGAPVSNVRPNGYIVREYDLVTDVLRFIADELRKVSPVLTGFYRKHHTLFADGTEVTIGGIIPEAREYVFINDVIYARKIEGVGRPAQSRQAPQGVFEYVALKADARFSNVVRVRFTWRAPMAGALLGGSQGNKSEARFPAILVRTGS